MKRIVKTAFIICLVVVQTSFGQNIKSLDRNTNVVKTLKFEAAMRESNSPFSAILYIISAGTQTKVLAKFGAYYKVEYNYRIGYINEIFFGETGLTGVKGVKTAEIKVPEQNVTIYTVDRDDYTFEHIEKKVVSKKSADTEYNSLVLVYDSYRKEIIGGEGSFNKHEPTKTKLKQIVKNAIMELYQRQ